MRLKKLRNIAENWSNRLVLSVRFFFIFLYVLVIGEAFPWGNTGHPERHTLALACDLETFSDGIRFNMNYREGVIQFVGDVNKVPISKSDSPLGGYEFLMWNPNREQISCNILMPSGSLLCATDRGNTLVGFCLLDRE